MPVKAENNSQLTKAAGPKAKPKSDLSLAPTYMCTMWTMCGSFYGQKGAHKTRHHFVAAAANSLYLFQIYFWPFMLPNFDLKIIKIVIKMQPRAQFMTTATERKGEKTRQGERARGGENAGAGRGQVLITSKRGSGPEAAARSRRLSAYGFLMVPCVGFVANKMAHIKSVLRGAASSKEKASTGTECGEKGDGRWSNCIGLPASETTRRGQVAVLY